MHCTALHCNGVLEVRSTVGLRRILEIVLQCNLLRAQLSSDDGAFSVNIPSNLEPT